MDECEPVGDDEPSLGSSDAVTNQERSWKSDGCGYWDLDRETECEDEGAQCTMKGHIESGWPTTMVY